MYQEISSYQLDELLNNKTINLIDVRDPFLYNLGTISPAKNIPVNNLISNPNRYLNKEDVYYVFCSHGNTSRELCNYLTVLGYKAVNIKDGYQGYIDSIN